MLQIHELTSIKDIDNSAADIARVMHHIHQMLEAGAQSASHLPLNSLMIVCGHACLWAAAEASDIQSHGQFLTNQNR